MQRFWLDFKKVHVCGVLHVIRVYMYFQNCDGWSNKRTNGQGNPSTGGGQQQTKSKNGVQNSSDIKAVL